MTATALFIIAFSFSSVLTGDAHASPPRLESGAYIYDGASPLEAFLSAPTVADWNNDGKKDLVIGVRTEGRIWLYLNQGTDAAPVFNGGSLIESNGSPIATSFV